MKVFLKETKAQFGLPKNNNKAQATIEITLGLIVAFLFLGAIIRFFVSANQNIIISQTDYQKSREKVLEILQDDSNNCPTEETAFYKDESGNYKEDNVFTQGLSMSKPKLLGK